jgi:hypothetical protein
LPPTRPAAKRRYFAGLARERFLLAFASLFADISTEMLHPILPVLLTQTLKTTGSIVELVDGAAQATQNIVQGFPARSRTNCKIETALLLPAIYWRRSPNR